MMCSKCGAEVPENKLVCNCFQVTADQEMLRIAIARFMDDEGWLWLTHLGDHLLPASRNSFTLCRLMRKPNKEGVVLLRRFKNPQVDPIHRAQLQKPWSDRVCEKCMEVVTAAAAEALEKMGAA